jgi:hypothetical protein
MELSKKGRHFNQGCWRKLVGWGREDVGEQWVKRWEYSNDRSRVGMTGKLVWDWGLVRGGRKVEMELAGGGLRKDGSEWFELHHRKSCPELKECEVWHHPLSGE